MTITDPRDSVALVERYLATWNEPNDARRRELVARVFAPAARYVDPLVASEGHAGIDAMIRAVQAQFPGHVFVRAGEPDRHANFLRFAWRLGPDGGPSVAGGTDFAVVDDEGRLASVTGFLDALPSVSAPATAQAPAASGPLRGSASS